MPNVTTRRNRLHFFAIMGLTTAITGPKLDAAMDRVMTFFEDLTAHSYTFHAEEPGVFNVGWLGDGHPIHTGTTSAGFRAALKTLCDNPICLHRGYHICHYCRAARGNGQIRIRSQHDVWYVAPTMILHYVTDHDYKPPDEFIDAVMNPREVATENPTRPKH